MAFSFHYPSTKRPPSTKSKRWRQNTVSTLLGLFHVDLFLLWCLLQDLWDESSRYPLHGLLHDSSSYRFVFININSELEELYDENKRLCDVKPFGATLKIIEKQNDRAENVFNVQIGRVIGKGLIFQPASSYDSSTFLGRSWTSILSIRRIISKYDASS